MRHRIKGTKLGRAADHRKALLRNLATSLALHGKVKTTSVKAKALISYYERLMTTAKRGDAVNAIRFVKKHLYTEPAQKAFIKRMNEAPQTSGYLRTTKVGFRPGDRAEVSLVEFVGSEKS
jgi:large subunit ribosomal protein L17